MNMKRISHICIVLLALLLLVGATGFVGAPEQAETTTVKVTVGNLQTNSDQILLVQGIDIEIRTESYEEWVLYVMDAVASVGGECTTWRDVEGELRNRSLTTEIPIGQYDTFLNWFTPYATVQHKDAYARDITDEYQKAQQDLEIAQANENTDAATLLRLEQVLEEYDHALSYCTVTILVGEAEPAVVVEEKSPYTSWLILGGGLLLIALLVLLFFLIRAHQKRKRRKRRRKRHSSSTWPNETRAWVGEDSYGNAVTRDVHELEKKSGTDKPENE